MRNPTVGALRGNEAKNRPEAAALPFPVPAAGRSDFDWLMGAPAFRDARSRTTAATDIHAFRAGQQIDPVAGGPRGTERPLTVTISGSTGANPLAPARSSTNK